MKKCSIQAIITSALLMIGCVASAAITSTYTDMGNLSSTVLGLTNSVTVQAGDVVVMIAMSNKKDSAGAINFTSAAGIFTEVSADVVLGGAPNDPNPDTYMAYLTVTSGGTYNFIAYNTLATVTANAGLYVLHADSGAVAVLDNDALRYDGYNTVGQAFAITNSLSWAGDTAYGDIAVIGAASSLKGNIYADTLVAGMDETNALKRLAGDMIVAAGPTSFNVVWTNSVLATGESGSSVAAAFAEYFPSSEPVLVNITNLVTDASGDGMTNIVHVLVLNGGSGVASNVTAGIAAATNADWFTIITNASSSNLAYGEIQTNEFIIIALTNAVGDYPFDVSVSADGGYSTNGSFTVVIPAPVVIPTAALEWWNMNDTVGTALKDLINSGSYGSPWSGGTSSLGVTDGSGIFVVGGASGKTTQKAPKAGTAYADATLNQYAVPLTNGAYSLVVNFDSWQWDAASEGDLWKLKAQSVNGTDIAGVELGIVAGQGRIRMWTQGLSNTYYRAYTVPAVSMAGATAQVIFDFDADTVSYVLNGVEQFSATDFVGENLGLLVYTTAGDGVNDWVTSASHIKINSMGLDTVTATQTPESIYNDWLLGNSYTSNTGLLEDANGDGVNNLIDYAIGGAANLPVTTSEGNYVTYVHVQWNETEAAARGLSYAVQATTNLVSGAWSTNGVEFVGSAADTPEAGYLTVTNRVPMSLAQGFLRLLVEFNSP